jgi:2-methylisocitrate lyase-like PEP mutase family enzyme
LLEAGALGCNLEDSDRHATAALVDADRQADYIAAVCAAGREAGVDVVVNARTDLYLRNAMPLADRMGETLRRGYRDLAAGATCVYPIGATEPTVISTLVEQMGGTRQHLAATRRTPISELDRIGVARISLAAGLQRHTATHVAALATSLLAGDDTRLRT